MDSKTRMERGGLVEVREQRLVQGRLHRNTIIQVLPTEGAIGPPVLGGDGAVLGHELAMAGHRFVVVADRKRVPAGFGGALAAPPPSGGDARLEWLKAPGKPLRPVLDPDPEARRETARRSWDGAVALRAAAEEAPGLRRPQVGAVHAVLARWTVGNEAQTVVMPTGTGKTEAMLVLLVHERHPKPLLVLVPSVTLRTQVARKFETLGMLRRLGVVGPGAVNPVVGRLEHRPRSAEEARDFCRRCNVVVANTANLAGLSDEVRQAVADAFGAVFIDEAHHVAAPTWAMIKDAFAARPDARIVQFTATPFRRDGQRVDGHVSYAFPLALAQREGYFRPIRFRPVRAYTAAGDQLVAQTAVDQLEADLAAGHGHVVMARTDDKVRAAEVLAIYQEIAPAHRPLAITSDLKPAEIEEAKRKLFDGETRVIVCVDMLGEGFDFPRLKVAALHDVHKSLAITLQFVGRFTRSGDGGGDATAVANIADAAVDRALQALYGEDADWNEPLVTLADGATREHVRDAALLQGFRGKDEVVSLRNIFPKMATVVFRTACASWDPERAAALFEGRREVVGTVRVNPDERIAVVVTHDREAIAWGRLRGIENSVWNLHVLH